MTMQSCYVAPPHTGNGGREGGRKILLVVVVEGGRGDGGRRAPGGDGDRHVRRAPDGAGPMGLAHGVGWGARGGP